MKTETVLRILTRDNSIPLVLVLLVTLAIVSGLTIAVLITIGII